LNRVATPKGTTEVEKRTSDRPFQHADPIVFNLKAIAAVSFDEMH